MKLEPCPVLCGLTVAFLTVLSAAAQESRTALSASTQSSNSISIQFPTDTGSLYTLQTATNVSTSSWTNLQTFLGAGSNTVIIEPITQQQQFFRLLVATQQPPPPAQFDPTQIGPSGSLLAYWNFNDLAVSNPVVAWMDRIHGVSLQPSGIAPTNTALGVFLDATPNGLTNAPLDLGSNFSVWVVVRPNLIDANARSIIGDSSSNGLAIQNGQLVGSWGGTNFASQQLNHAYPGDTNETFDIVDAYGTVYTNGAACPNGAGAPSASFSFSRLGNSSVTGNFSGFIQYAGVWTNYQLTAMDVASLDAWVNTNGVTNVTGGLVAWYRFDEGTGTNAFDSSGNNHTGTLVGSPTWIPGLIGQALSFSGNGQVVNCGNVADGMPAFASSFWTKSDNFWDGTLGQENYGTSILDKSPFSTAVNGQGWGVFNDAPFDCKGYVADTNGNYYESGPIEVSGGYFGERWHLVVCNYFYKIPLVLIYLDGQPYGGWNGSPEIRGVAPVSISGNSPLFIAGDIELLDASCEMDDVRIYNRPLSDQEVAMLYRWRGQP
jgi:hypothetical protein